MMLPLTRVEFERLVERGAFDEDDHIELLDGELVEMSPQGTRHSGVITRLTKIFVRIVGDDADVRAQLPFAAGVRSLPEPDLAVVPPGDYEDANPSSALLIVEVAAESLHRDRTVKARLYASAGVPEYWVVDVNKKRVERFDRLVRGRYSRATFFGLTDTIPFDGFDAIRVSDFLR